MARIDAQSLMQWCRALRHGLDIDLKPAKVFRQQSKTGPSRLRDISASVADQVEEGESIADSLQAHSSSFPSLFLQMVSVGEVSGRLPTMFAEMERHYETVLATQKLFRNSMIKPVAIYFIAILILALLIYIMGMISKNSNPIGFGLSGGTGALVVLMFGFGFAGIVYFSAWVLISNEALKSKFASMFLPIPVIGNCLKYFALSRFCLTMHATIEAGFKADEAVRTSLKATANERYVSIAPHVAKSLRKGEEIAETLASYGPSLFPDEMVQSLQVGEETGRLAEVLDRETANYRTKAHELLNAVIYVLTKLIYAMVMIFVIFAMYKIYSSTLGPVYQQAFDAVDNPEKWLRGQ